MSTKDTRFKDIVIAESKRFKLVAEQVFVDEVYKSDEDASLVLYFDGVKIAEAGCGCCGFCIDRAATVAMIEGFAKAGE